MQVVLNQDVKNLGSRGEIVDVKRGYFRNFLFPRGLADLATGARLRVAEARRSKVDAAKQAILDNAKDFLKKVAGLKVKVSSKGTDQGKLYGSIVEEDVIEAVEKSSGITLNKEFLKMDHFKEAGEHEAVVHLGEGLEEEIVVEVEATK